MKSPVAYVLTIIAVMLIIIGGSGLDSEQLLIPSILVLSGCIIGIIAMAVENKLAM